MFFYFGIRFFCKEYNLKMQIEIIWGVVFVYLILFLISILIRDNSIVDIYWGIGFFQIAIHSLILSNNYSLQNIIFSLIIFLWSLRLSSYISYKRIKRKKEDPRYLQFREEWKFFHIRSFFQIYILQALLMFIIAIPIFLFILSNTLYFNLFFYFGAFIAILGLIFETIADFQLMTFIKNKQNKSKILNTGLWKYSRHPNYFGESIFWLGISIIAVQISIFALISYILITVLLRFVSGVPLLEKNYIGNKEYDKYKKITPPFIPKF